MDRPAGSLLGFADGVSPLMCAVKREYLQSVQTLFAAKVDVNRKDQAGHTALYYAVSSDNETMVSTLLVLGADPMLDAEVERQARFDTDIGRMILAALQPALEGRASGNCPPAVQPPVSPATVTPAAALDPLRSEDFPAARVEVIDAIPPVANEFSLSPDGQWLVVQEEHQKSPQQRSHRLVMYALSAGQAHFLMLPGGVRVREDGWHIDSRRYVLGDHRRQIIDVSSGLPQLKTLAKPLSHSERLYAGGEPCPWRNDQGQVVLHRPDMDKLQGVWSADGKLEYFLEAGDMGEYFLVARRGKMSRPLIRHRVTWLRDQRKAMMVKAMAASKHAERQELEQMFSEMPLEQLSASRFALSADGRYLFYRIGQRGGPGFFGLSSRNIVVDVKSTPLQVWVLEGKPWGTPQWHPNGRDLYFINQNADIKPDPNFPPMRQPRKWRLSVARFP